MMNFLLCFLPAYQFTTIIIIPGQFFQAMLVILIGNHSYLGTSDWCLGIQNTPWCFHYSLIGWGVLNTQLTGCDKHTPF